METARANVEKPATAADGQAYAWAGVVLRVGFYISFALIGAGLIWGLASGALDVSTVPVARAFSEMASNPAALVSVGLLSLIATPVVTLLATLAGYIAARNVRFAALAAFILAILTLSVAMSLGWLRVG